MSVSRSGVVVDWSIAVATAARGAIVGCAALAALFALACNRSDREPSPAPSATPGAPPAVEAPGSPAPVADAVAAPVSAPGKGEPGVSTNCSNDADCRTFSDACPVCSCRPLAKTSPDPKCATKRATCLIDPCTGLHAVCRKGTCIIGDPGDAAASDAARVDAASVKKDASEPDAPSKGAGSSAPAGSAAPKAGDAARD